MLIDVHMLKNYPPTNLNRDETGSPKSCYFSGTQRGRISSQCQKQSWRRGQEFLNMKLGIRTRFMPDYVGDILNERGIDIAFVEEAKRKLSKLGQNEDKQKDKKVSKENEESEEKKVEQTDTKQIMFYSDYDLCAIADEMEKAIRESKDIREFQKQTNKDVQKTLKELSRPATIDIALFGRMITDESFHDVEAALQVAHAISTNVVNQESDYFTAVDDLNKKYGQDAGSAMIGEIDFNSCCYYHYASLDVDQLKRNMYGNENEKSIIQSILATLIKAMAFTNPSGKQNSFAGHVLPGLICVEVKDKNIPINYVNAFARPVRNGDYMEESQNKLKDEINNIDDCFGKLTKERFWFSATKKDDGPKNSTLVKSFDELVELCNSCMKEV